MAWYYGVNNSELYGSNFSTVLADAPPPLDDTCEEDDNEIVFRNETKKSKKFNEKTVASPVKKRHLSDDFNDKSKFDGSVPNGENSLKCEQEGTENVEEDFGDFASFADFGSAFGQDSTSGGESQGWSTSNENSVKSFPVENTKRSPPEQPGNKLIKDNDDDEFADFAAFQEHDSSPNNQENVPDEGLYQRNSNSDWFNKSTLESQDISSNGVMESDDDGDFGEFASMENAITSPEEMISENSKSTQIQPILDHSLTSQGKRSAEDDSKFEEVNISKERNTVWCNGDVAGKKSVNHLGERIVNHNPEESLHGIDKDNSSSLEELSLSEQDNKVGTEGTATKVVSLENTSNSTDSEQKSWPVENDLSVVDTCEEYHPGNSSITVQKPNEQDQTVNSKERDQENSLLSKNKGTEESEMSEQDEKNSRNVNLNDSSTSRHGSESQRLPDSGESKDDSFGEFADFNNHSLKETPIDNSENGEFVDREKENSGDMPEPKAVDRNGIDTVQTKTASPGDKGDDDDFGDFGAFVGNNRKSESVFVAAESKPKSSFNENKDDDDFGGFGAFEANSRSDLPDNKNIDNDSFAKFGAFNPDDKPLPSEDQSSDDFGTFGTVKSNVIDSGKDDDDDDDDKGDSSDFGGFESRGKDSQKVDDDDDFGSFDSKAKHFQKSDNNTDDFRDFGSFESDTKDPHKDDDDDDDFGNFGNFESNKKDFQKDDGKNGDFGDFGSFESNAKDSLKGHEDTDNFGNCGSFESNAKDLEQHSKSDGFGDFDAFNSQAADAVKKNESDNEFGNFGTFESKEKANDLSFGDFGAMNSQTTDLKKKNESDDEFGDFGAFESTEKTEDHSHSSFKSLNASESKKEQPAEKTKENNRCGDIRTSHFSTKETTQNNLNNSGQTDDDFGDFSSRNDQKSEGFRTFSSNTAYSSVTLNSSPRKTVDLKPKTETSSHFSPGMSVVIKQAEHPISMCFTSELRQISGCPCDILSTRVERRLHGNMGLWQHLDHSEKDERILFNWSNSFSQHKKFLSLTICPDRPPPLQAGSMLKPMVMSQFSTFGGGPAGSVLMPEAPSKLSQFSSGLGFLEPVKGPLVPGHHAAQDKITSHHSAPPDVALPDLSFILGSGLKRTASKSDVKDNASDTASESSSLDLDFFAPSTTQPSDGKSESRGLYEEDLMGLNILSSSVEPQKLDSPKPQKTSDTKKVWQHGGVTIPLSSQQNRTELSATAKSILGQLEDLTFMTSSVLMFPLKTE